MPKTTKKSTKKSSKKPKLRILYLDLFLYTRNLSDKHFKPVSIIKPHFESVSCVVNSQRFFCSQKAGVSCL